MLFGSTPLLVGSLKASKRALDAPVIARNCQILVGNATSDIGAWLLAVKADQGSDCIIALKISACGLRIGNGVIRSAIGLRLELNLCVHHSCPCGGAVNAKGLHMISCKSSAGRSIRHPQSCLAWSTQASIRGPSGLLPRKDKRPDGLTLIPWQGRRLAWDAAVVCTLVPSYGAASGQVTASAEQAAA